MQSFKEQEVKILALSYLQHPNVDNERRIAAVTKLLVNNTKLSNPTTLSAMNDFTMTKFFQPSEANFKNWVIQMMTSDELIQFQKAVAMDNIT